MVDGNDLGRLWKFGTQLGINNGALVTRKTANRLRP
jgi:hypothetical protein